MVPKIGSLVAAVVIALLTPQAAALAADAEPVHLDLRDPGWELAGDDTVVEEFDGQVALRLKTGSATWRGVELSGRLEDTTGLEVEAGGGTGETAAGVSEDGSSAGELGGLTWLAGCWKGEAGEECWLAPRGGMMLGVNRGPDREGRPPFFELLRVVEDEEGLVLLAQPVGQSPAVPFRAVEIGDSRVVFANPEHDFPQRITYWREGATLKARVEAQRDGEWQGFEQTWSPGTWPGE